MTPSLAYAGLVEHAPGVEAEGSHLGIALVSTAVALAGITLAAVLYLGKREKTVEELTRAADSVGLYRLSHGKFYFDELYNAVVVAPLRSMAEVCYAVDRAVIDAAVNFFGLAPTLLGAILRPLQNGLLPFYALAMVLGLLALIVGLMV
jgi:NADH-quinone oxidoreductase subunit L